MKFHYGTQQFTGLVPETEESLAELEANATDFRPFVEGLYSAPEEVDPREHMVVENQGSMGSCQGHAISTCVELLYFFATGTYIQLSRLFGYIGTQKISGSLGSDRGSSISGGVKLAKEYGICREEVMPYPNPVRYTTHFTDGAWDDARNFRVATHSVLRSYVDVFDYLASGVGVVSIGIRWSGCRFENDTLVSFHDSGSGGHAVVLFGYSKRKDSRGRNYLLLANSWGDRWQGDGIVEVAPSAVDAMFRSRFTVMIGVSDMIDIKPRPYNFREEFLK